MRFKHIAITKMYTIQTQMTLHGLKDSAPDSLAKCSYLVKESGSAPAKPTHNCLMLTLVSRLEYFLDIDYTMVCDGAANTSLRISWTSPTATYVAILPTPHLYTSTIMSQQLSFQHQNLGSRYEKVYNWHDMTIRGTTYHPESILRLTGD